MSVRTRKSRARREYPSLARHFTEDLCHRGDRGHEFNLFLPLPTGERDWEGCSAVISNGGTSHYFSCWYQSPVAWAGFLH
jgi:hypothetical protein